MSQSSSYSSMRGRQLLFFLFFCSGFSGLIYQVVWLRMAFAHFGIVTPVLSVVISVFMAGLGIGSLLAGRWVGPVVARTGVAPARLYAVAELVIGAGAFAVPVLFAAGDTALLGLGHASSGAYLGLSALVIAGAMLPWCVMMGTTYPLMMAHVRGQGAPNGHGEGESFSYLYLANVVGAMCGTLASALVLIESFGFAATSMIAALVNVGIAVVAFLLPRPQGASEGVGVAAPVARGPAVGMTDGRRRWVLAVLFTTGFCSLAMEVVWTRAYTVILTTTIYAFAAILATYLLATWLGSALYRARLRRAALLDDRVVLFAACAGALLPVVLVDPRVQFLAFAALSSGSGAISVVLALVGLVPFCVALGYLTPKLIDDYARGDPDHAGRCYAVNILGSILGPLVAGYLLVPLMNERTALIVLTVPLLLLVLTWAGAAERARLRGRRALIAVTMLLGFAAIRAEGFEDFLVGEEPRMVRRDHVATAIAYGQGMERRLLVNGVGITSLTPITKLMSHLPTAVHGQARDGLVICFGMGTSLRSMAAWDINVTAVDLVPSVPETFAFFHDDAARVVANPKVSIVVDDGRRFLLRTEKMFDIIVIDPPPPAEAAGSSLLYSTGFYAAAKRRLRAGGILQQWIPGDVEPAIVAAVARSVREAFPHVQVYQSLDGWGHHFLASMGPIPEPELDVLLARMPAAARRDLVEWGPHAEPEAMLRTILGGRRSLESVLLGQSAPPITDDRPFNEYYLLRRLAKGEVAPR